MHLSACLVKPPVLYVSVMNVFVMSICLLVGSRQLCYCAHVTKMNGMQQSVHPCTAATCHICCCCLYACCNKCVWCLCCRLANRPCAAKLHKDLSHRGKDIAQSVPMCYGKPHVAHVMIFSDLLCRPGKAAVAGKRDQRDAAPSHADAIGLCKVSNMVSPQDAVGMRPIKRMVKICTLRQKH